TYPPLAAARGARNGPPLSVEGFADPVLVRERARHGQPRRDETVDHAGGDARTHAHRPAGGAGPRLGQDKGRLQQGAQAQRGQDPPPHPPRIRGDPRRREGVRPLFLRRGRPLLRAHQHRQGGRGV
ncbi:unnamed protein product, partial [Ectocarpus fasciculatus]